jgi:hypothetical protein
MLGAKKLSTEIFSLHLANLPLVKIPPFLLCPTYKNNIPGLQYSESLVVMNLGMPIMSARRYNFKTVAFFAWWSEESFLNEFLERPSHKFWKDGWHIRMKLYRRWGEVTQLRDAHVCPELRRTDKPVVAVTLARLNILEIRRFIKWGKPVESQVRDHKGKTLALAAIRPFNTFSTFSVWKNEIEMVDMVNEQEHNLAMQERARKDFHYEFTTMRFTPFKEFGVWNGQTNCTSMYL